MDSAEFAIEPGITRLVGKNESGKTAILQALHKSNPVQAGPGLDEIVDFPTPLARQRRAYPAGERIPVTRLTLRLGPQEIRGIEDELGPGTLAEVEFHVTSGYRTPSRSFELWLDEAAAVNHLRSTLDEPCGPEVASAVTVEELYSALSALEEMPGSAMKLAALIEDWPDRRLDLRIIEEHIRPRLPKFAYFAECDTMPGQVSVHRLIDGRDSGELSRGEQSLLSLLTLAGVRPEELLEVNQQEQLIRELEDAANALSDEVLSYWSQNTQLDVTLAMLAGDDGPVLQIRLRDRRHRASVPFDERSRGFVWFFSFLAHVTELERQEQDLVLLLDEPGLYLHGRAQQDLLRLITERLAPRHQVIFTTHSPFMISPGSLSEIRTVTDHDKNGTTVGADFTTADADTTAPLVTALAAELSKSLLVGERTLLVNRPSDLIHLDVLSGLLEARGRSGLDSRWSPAPVGGAVNLAVITALNGPSSAVMLTDGAAHPGTRGLVEIGEFTGGTAADLEDLYETEFYLALVNHAYSEQLAAPIRADELTSTDPRIVERLRVHFRELGLEFNPYPCAALLLRDAAAMPNAVDGVTLTRAERLFARVNELL
ncbi:AAA family ATPase [Longispora albida]|uniref:AAA family ATPase n=1 Tax=Longispora albida TaxID=203523 RepID=UPI0006879D32|nr:AAA family ATPase [Longispora albida]